MGHELSSFLDRDGTINTDKEYVHRIPNFEFVLHPQTILDIYRKRCIAESPGLLVTAMREDGIAPNDAVIIGDRNSDIEAGQALGINDLSYLAETGHVTTEKYKTKPLTLFQICRGRPNHVVDVEPQIASQRFRRAAALSGPEPMEAYVFTNQFCERRAEDHAGKFFMPRVS